MGEALITRRGGGGGEQMFTNYSKAFYWYCGDHSPEGFGDVYRGQPKTITANIQNYCDVVGGGSLKATDAVKEGVIIPASDAPVVPFKAGETLTVNCAHGGNFYEMKTSVSNSTGKWVVTAEVHMLSTSAENMGWFDVGSVHGTIE